MAWLCLFPLIHFTTYSRLKFKAISLSSMNTFTGIWERPIKIPPVILSSYCEVYHGCLRISWTRYLTSGLVYKMLRIMSFASSLAIFGIVYSPFRIFLYRLAVLGSSKGKYPQIRAKRITPQDHMSTWLP